MSFNITKLASILLISLLLTVTSVVAAPKYSVQDFFSHGKFQNVIVSPDGKHFAVTYRKDTEVRLAIINRKTNKVISGFDYGEYRRIGAISWLNNERIIFSVRKFVGLWDKKGGAASRFVANIDGTKRINLTKKLGGFSVVSLLRDQPKHILIEKGRYEAGSVKAKLQVLDIYKGTMKFNPDAPQDDVHGFVANIHGNPRVAISTELEDKNSLDVTFTLHYKDLGDQWQKLALESDVKKPRFNVIGFSADDQKFYFSSDYDDPENLRLGVHEFDLSKKSASLIYRSDKVDVGTALRRAPDNGQLVAFGYDDGFSRWKSIDNKHWYSQLIASFEAAFVDSNVVITSMTADHNEAVIYVNSDINSGEFYTYNRKFNKLKFYAAVQPALKARDMAYMNPFSMKARDGVELHGYVTLPKGKKKNLPTIVKIHGGPHGPRDNWGWDTEAQFLAHNGYAVVQINFRGSGGYGKAFEESGHRKWGREMQDDVTDATLWAIDQGIADKDRICVYGGSYGGYSTAMAVVREPDLYKCGLPYVGVYSLPEMKKSGDIPIHKYGRLFLEKVLGNDQADLEARSPSFNVRNIKANLFIAHGSDDQRCPMEQYDALTDALDEAGIKYKSMVRDEGHGYQIEKNRYDFYSAMLEFFDENLK
ncbi:S9 family peptidase [Psychrobium sp. 1_MG-2023]|uniref:alpha/beta hydrolase family protein n=1 Tax=Psychrobium sp. 1_MG-2023 TaxID=3062624 RepID=UPI000C3468BD|nr:prolyl oligopeptidase family serine peptidase [Psychrobium sp. 1_MG-2023]MDP2560970.1 prolyl oligopeptidase family serine peptidase [Psychrobium sp. 1_MG-2023]PKF54947.1 S9 family peptidase [Alteromonadales bacterium alter-6D02]